MHYSPFFHWLGVRVTVLVLLFILSMLLQVRHQNPDALPCLAPKDTARFATGWYPMAVRACR
jgi:hypothetical protein